MLATPGIPSASISGASSNDSSSSRKNAASVFLERACFRHCSFFSFFDAEHAVNFLSFEDCFLRELSVRRRGFLKGA